MAHGQEHLPLLDITVQFCFENKLFLKRHFETTSERKKSHLLSNGQVSQATTLGNLKTFLKVVLFVCCYCRSP